MGETIINCIESFKIIDIILEYNKLYSILNSTLCDFESLISRFFQPKNGWIATKFGNKCKK